MYYPGTRCVRRLNKRLRRFGELSGRQRLLLLRALIVLALTRIALSVCSVATARNVAAISTASTKIGAVEELVWAVRAASRYVPKAPCLAQAVAMHALLTQSGHASRVEVGVMKHSRFEAHAWVVCD